MRSWSRCRLSLNFKRCVCDTPVYYGNITFSNLRPFLSVKCQHCDPDRNLNRSAVGILAKVYQRVILVLLKGRRSSPTILVGEGDKEHRVAAFHTGNN